ncbi:accessory gland protein Acp29AB-like [Drosophila nasuta]|uniref:accessory gland protein Acp29AB-like n=1 Tax=Drosophila nasuta TaxID=42062 RepID=UPI00295E8E9E|nr:accessory gland protein Acp29AB-like [Drosophila nasuta]
MNTLFVFFLASVLVVYGSENNLQESKQQKTSCVNYCSNIMKPVLNVTRNLQNQVNDFKHQTKCLSQFESTNKMMEEKFASQDKKIDQKLGDLSNATEEIMEQIKLQGKQVEQQMEHLHKTEELKKQIPGPPYQKIGSKYYYIEESEEVNWFRAVNKCLILGGHLVNFQNQDEFNAVKGKLQANQDYWIDLNDLAKEGEFISVATGQKPKFLNWHIYEPNNEN